MTIEDTMMYVTHPTDFSYGYLTHTNTKLLLMLQLREDPVPDSDVLTIFRAIQDAYVSYVSNPFVNVQPGELPGSDAQANLVPPSAPLNMDRDSRAITSATFEKRIKAIAGWTSAPAA